MRKIINNPEDVVSEMMEGFVNAYSRYYKKHPKVNGIILKQKRKDKVSLVIGGGSGHEPVFSGFVGKGLADAAACGNIFASPDPMTIYETAKAVDQGRGILFVYGCYAGDNLNFDMGEEFLRDDGILTAHVRVQDDVASAGPDRVEERRGIAGDVFVIKIAGAACDAGLDLAEVLKVTEKARDNIKSIGIATSSAQLPGIEKPIFELGEDEIEYGMGLHGERGILRTKWQPADVLVEKMYSQIKEDADWKANDEVCVLVNGLGSTTITELAIVYRKVKELLYKDGIKIYDADLNHYCTSQEMGGFSITLFRLDEQLKNYYDMPCYSPYYAKEDRTGYTETVDVLNAQDVKDMLIYTAGRIIDKKEYLTELDSAIGDGDHGIGMSGGMKKMKEELEQLDDVDNVYEIFEKAGKAMLMSMGGASGVIFGSLFMSGAKNMEPKAELTAVDFAEMEKRSLQAIQERGKARVGDKTMVDALSPAVDAMAAHCKDGLPDMLKATEDAARQGAEDTKNYQARFGRAKSLMERAVGYKDAGAVSVWLIFKSMREFVEGRK